MKPFEQEYWNFTTAIIWIYLRDRNFIEKKWNLLKEDKFAHAMYDAEQVKAERYGYDRVTDIHGKEYDATPASVVARFPSGSYK